jgi:hypothetical protein
MAKPLAEANTCKHYINYGYCKLVNVVKCVKQGRSEIYCANWQNWRTRDAGKFK